MNALIIDDDPITSRALSRQLLSLGVTSTECLTIEAAKEILKSKTPHFICLDLVLPGETGIDFLQERERSVSMKKIPVVVISGKADLQTIREALIAGANAYLIKPIQMKMLRLEVEKIESAGQY